MKIVDVNIEKIFTITLNDTEAFDIVETLQYVDASGTLNESAHQLLNLLGNRNNDTLDRV